MQRSSETIGAIAGALAKAQIELANPEKSLTATIRAHSRAKRIAPFATRRCPVDWIWSDKCLGRHEIATIQTTAIDKEAGLIHLTTVLAHSSGEWMSSDSAGVRRQRNQCAASHGSGADLCKALCAVHPGRNCGRG